MVTSFLKIDRTLFQLSDESVFKYIKTEGFTIYNYLLWRQRDSEYCQVTIKNIQDVLSKDYNNRPILKKYGEEKQHKVSTIKDKKTIIKYLSALQEKKLIEIDRKIPTRINDSMIINCVKLDCEKGFNAIPEKLFIDYIHKIGHIGYSLLCLLSQLHNINNGGTGCVGFANPSEEYMKFIIRRDTVTIRSYLYLLQDLKLIKIEYQNPIKNETYNESKNKTNTYQCNHYIVNFKVPENKYYIQFKMNNKKKEIN